MQSSTRIKTNTNCYWTWSATAQKPQTKLPWANCPICLARPWATAGANQSSHIGISGSFCWIQPDGRRWKAKIIWLEMKPLTFILEESFSIFCLPDKPNDKPCSRAWCTPTAAGFTRSMPALTQLKAQDLRTYNQPIKDKRRNHCYFKGSSYQSPDASSTACRGRSRDSFPQNPCNTQRAASLQAFKENSKFK